MVFGISGAEKKQAVRTVVYSGAGILIALGIKDWAASTQYDPILLGLVILIGGSYLLNLK